MLKQAQALLWAGGRWEEAVNLWFINIIILISNNFQIVLYFHLWFAWYYWNTVFFLPSGMTVSDQRQLQTDPDRAHPKNRRHDWPGLLVPSVLTVRAPTPWYITLQHSIKFG